MFKKLWTKLFWRTEGEDLKQIKKVQAKKAEVEEKKARVHKASLTRRIGKLEEEIRAVEMELSQMRGEMIAEVRHAQPGQGQAICDAYEEWKAKGEAALKSLRAQVKSLRAQL